MQPILAVTTIIETALNRLLFSAAADDRQIQSARHRLSGKVLRLDIEELSHPITLVFSRSQADVLSQWEGEVHCTVKAPLSVLLRLRGGQNALALIRSGELEVEGDSDVVQRLVALAELVDWDLADELAPYIGDSAAYALSDGCLKAARGVQNLLIKQQANFRETVKEEWLMLPNPLELAYLSDRIAGLAHDVEALSNRVEKLTSDDDSC